MTAQRIADIALTSVGVSAKTNWLFLELTLDDGSIGTGEATLHGYEPLIRAWVDHWRPDLVGRTLDALRDSLPVGRITRAGQAAHAAISALEQARVDLVAQQSAKPLSVALGLTDPAVVPVYANINRGLTDRAPESFAAHAARAVGKGYSRLKIAPFDGVSAQATDGQANEARLQLGLDRIRAVRGAIGSGDELYVDCHWRLTPDRAEALLPDLESCGVSWFECPLYEEPRHFSDLARLRRLANDHGMLLAGAEMEVGVAGFRPFAEIYDVVMPDIKYCGGPDEMLRIAEMAQDLGARVAPHNPSGPIANAHSVHACAHPGIFLLEFQLDETPLFDRVVQGAHPAFRHGTAAAPDAPGLGLALDREVCGSLPESRILSAS